MQQVEEGIHPELMFLIHQRTPDTGHLEATMTLEGSVMFVDEELARGRLVILDIAGESWVIRTGREVVDFVRRVLGGKKEPQPKLTTLSPMAGGSGEDGTGATEAMPVPMPVMPRADYDGPGAMAVEAPRPYGLQQPRMADPRAEVRSWQELVARIGETAARAMLVGGGYAVRSKLWPYVVYVVTPQTIKVINQGVQVSSICIISPDSSPLWDVVLNRIDLLQAGVEGEVQVFATGEIRR